MNVKGNTVEELKSNIAELVRQRSLTYVEDAYCTLDRNRRELLSACSTALALTAKMIDELDIDHD